MVFYGQGYMDDYYLGVQPWTTSPWSDKRKSIKYVIIENGVTNVSSSAFYYYKSGDDNYFSNFLAVRMGNSVTTIGDLAFRNCENLKTMVIGNGLSKIGLNVFISCKSMSELYYYGTTQPQYGKYAFENCPTSIIIFVPFNYENLGETFMGYNFTISNTLFS